MSMQEKFELNRDNLFSASQIMPIVNDTMTIAEGQDLKRGALLDVTGTLVTTGKDVYAVLAEDTVTGSGETKEAPVYLTGEFSEEALSVNSAITVDSVKASARKVGIFIKKNI